MLNILLEKHPKKQSKALKKNDSLRFTILKKTKSYNGFSALFLILMV